MYQRRLPSNPSKDYYYIHRETGKTEPIIVEYGFLDSKGDDVNQLKNNYETYAEAVVKAITEYLNVPYSKNKTDYYVVQKGDTLYSIALKNNTTVTKLKELNNLIDNTISIGQNLLLPGTVSTEISDYYIVKNGDTLYGIALANNVSVDELKKINNLNNNLINIGQKLLLPNNKKIYTVKSGDTLYSIAKRFNTNINELKNINNLTSNLLNIGQDLILPN